jgi:hypothetical protein
MNNLKLGDKVEFTYHGSQEEYSGRRVQGEVVDFIPRIQFAGGSVPLDESGYVTDVKLLDPPQEPATNEREHSDA